MKIRYFDHAATTAVREEVVRAMLPYLGVEYGNPSSVYSLGRKNKKIVEENRSKVAKAINADQNEIYFTSCGSESDNLALKGIMLANKSRGRHLITTKIEHPAILNTCKWLENNGFDVTYLNVDENGLIKRGVIIRHLVLPGHIQNSKHILKWLKENVNSRAYVSVMAQYFPTYKAKEDKYLNRKLTNKEYSEIEQYLYLLDIENGYMQDLGKHEEEYVPDF